PVAAGAGAVRSIRPAFTSNTQARVMTMGKPAAKPATMYESTSSGQWAPCIIGSIIWSTANEAMPEPPSARNTRRRFSSANQPVQPGGFGNPSAGPEGDEPTSEGDPSTEGDRWTGNERPESPAPSRLRTSLVVCGRSAGFFRSSSETSWPSQSGMPGTVVNDGGSSWRIRATVAALESV